MADESTNPYKGMTRTGKAWYAAFCETAAAMAQAVSDGDWAAAEGWATIASWQHEMLTPTGSDN